MILPSFKNTRPGRLRPVNIDQFYDSLAESYLSYNGLFRALISAEQHLDISCAAIATTAAEGLCSSTLPHPIILEAGIQSLLLAFAAPRDCSLRTPFTTTKISWLVLFPNSYDGLAAPVPLTVNARLPEDTPWRGTKVPAIRGDIDICNSETGEIQIRLFLAYNSLQKG